MLKYWLKVDMYEIAAISELLPKVHKHYAPLGNSGKQYWHKSYVGTKMQWVLLQTQTLST